MIKRNRNNFYVLKQDSETELYNKDKLLTQIQYDLIPEDHKKLFEVFTNKNSFEDDDELIPIESTERPEAKIKLKLKSTRQLPEFDTVSYEYFEKVFKDVRQNMKNTTNIK